MVLPQTFDERRDERTEPARNKGHIVHKFLERVKAIGRDVALAEVPEEHRILCAVLDVDRMPTHLSTEVAMAYNWRTRESRELGRNLGHRDYHLLFDPPTEDEIPCTIDVMGWAEITVTGKLRRRGFVSDYKTGHTTYPRPGAYGQTMLGALCLLGVMPELDDVTVELIHIHSDGDHHSVRDTVTLWDLEMFETELGDRMESLPDLERLSAAELPYFEGHHCDYCDSYKSCEAKISLVRELPTGLMKIGMVPPGETGKLEMAPGAVTVRSAAFVFEQCERFEALIGRLKAEVCAMAYHEPITLSDGRIIERHTDTRRSVDGRIAAAVLEQEYGREEAMKTVEIKASIDALRRLVTSKIDINAKPRQVITSQKGTGLLDLLLDKIAKRGGLKTTTSEVCRPRTPPKLPAGK